MDNERDETPTRPDNPAVAQRCVHCGKAYGEHAQTTRPQTSDRCRGTRAGFERTSSTDESR